MGTHAHFTSPPPTHTHHHHTQVELVEPPAGAAIGERLVVEGFGGEADEQLNPKKKVWEAVSPSSTPALCLPQLVQG